ncbi:MAG: LysM peptidoglycan-binding domain-containing M23 family metallopeptidase [Pseudomonadota bacterium]
MTFLTRCQRTGLLITCAALALTACSEPLDLDFRGLTGGFSTSDAAANAVQPRPEPDDRGVISYPNYQVAVARRGDTLRNVAVRVGLPAEEVSRFNGIDPDTGLREGEVIALPRRVTEPSPATGAIGTGPIQPPGVDVTTLAGNAINNAPATPRTQQPAPTAPAQTGEEPTRHKVERGETAYSIARLYDVPVKSLAEWNGLGGDFAIREGQFLLIPVARQAPPQQASQTVTETTLPGTGSETPTPPSASAPLPNQDETPRAAQTVSEEPVADIGETTKPTSRGRMAFPVDGNIIRDYAKGRNEGIDIKGAAGGPVKAAESGTVAAITESSEGVPIVVLRHPDNLLTVYANVADVAVKKGDSVGRGQSIAKLRSGDDAFVHFEVRDGFDSVDPTPYLQ